MVFDNSFNSYAFIVYLFLCNCFSLVVNDCNVNLRQMLIGDIQVHVIYFIRVKTLWERAVGVILQIGG